MQPAEKILEWSLDLVWNFHKHPSDLGSKVPVTYYETRESLKLKLRLLIHINMSEKFTTGLAFRPNSQHRPSFRVHQWCWNLTSCNCNISAPNELLFCWGFHYLKPKFSWDFACIWNRTTKMRSLPKSGSNLERSEIWAQALCRSKEFESKL